MHTTRVTLSNMLSSQRQHIIPVFQRSYSWKPKNWKQLWLDLQALLNEKDKTYEHFLGPMIIDHGDTGSYVPEKYLVIDGQQRLVTLSLILCVIRDVARIHQIESIASSVADHLVFRTPDGDEENRLIPRSDDRIAYERVVNSEVTRHDSGLQIVKAYRYFMREVKRDLRTSEQTVPDFLKDLYTVVIARLKFVSITLESKDDPTKIYESMNSTGQPLLVADLIRNFVMMHLSPKTQDAFFESVWEPYENLLVVTGKEQDSAKELEDFYYRYLIERKGYFAKRLVYSKYKEYLECFLKGSNDDEEKRNSLKLLVVHQSRYAKYYRRIVHPEIYEEDAELCSAFMRFGFLDAITATPFILSLYDRYEEEEALDHITKTDFLSIMNGIESFILRRSIMRLRTRGYGLDFAQAVTKSKRLQELWEHFDDKDWPDDSAIGTALVEFPLYLRERKKARLILEQLENSFGHKERVDLSDRGRIQIEHVMPRKDELSQVWQGILGDDANEIHAKYLHSLGNLTLTGYNQELGAKSFEDKKSEYAKHGSHIELNKYILEQDQWTEAEITDRARQLTARFIEIWPRPKTPKQNES